MLCHTIPLQKGPVHKECQKGETPLPRVKSVNLTTYGTLGLFPPNLPLLTGLC